MKQNGLGLGFMKMETQRPKLFNKQCFLFNYLQKLPEEVKKELGFNYFNIDRLKLMIDTAMADNLVTGTYIAFECMINTIHYLEEDEIQELLDSDAIEYFIDKVYVNKRNIEASFNWRSDFLYDLDPRVKDRMINCIIEKIPTLRASTIAWIFKELEEAEDYYSSYLCSIFFNKNVYEGIKIINDKRVLKAIMKTNLTK